mmetsp:Transcript_6675/g.15388  ORF Transcript_6675/g.15388 Transcript_6675/m.15388 type:complete len:742 (-) Transcript_6675:101-2326(-)
MLHSIPRIALFCSLQVALILAEQHTPANMLINDARLVHSKRIQSRFGVLCELSKDQMSMALMNSLGLPCLQRLRGGKRKAKRSKYDEDSDDVTDMSDSADSLTSSYTSTEYDETEYSDEDQDAKGLDERDQDRDGGYDDESSAHDYFDYDHAFGKGKKQLALRDTETRDETEAEGQNILTISSEGHVQYLAKGLRELQEAAKFTDITVKGQGEAKIAAHKAILAAASPELRKIIEDLPAGAKELDLQSMDGDSLTIVFDYIYARKIKVSEEKLPDLLGVSQKLGVSGLKDTCYFHLMKDLKPSNALRMRHLGKTLECHELLDAANRFIMHDFVSVSKSQSFNDLSEDALYEIIGSDDLFVESEKVIFDSVIRWVEFNEVNRSSSLLRLMGQIRFGLLPLDVLAKKVAAAPLIHKHLASNPQWQAMLNAAIAYVGSTPEQRQMLESPQTKVRLGSKGRYLVCAGGRKGKNSDALKSALMIDSITGEGFVLDDMHIARKQVSAAEADGLVYVAGGWDGHKYMRSVELFDLASNTWKKGPAMLTARGSFGMANLGGMICAAGGYDGHKHLSSCEFLNRTMQVWQQMAPMLHARSGVRLAVLGDRLYAVGGFDGKNVLNTVEIYDSVTMKWVEGPPLNHARRDHAMAVLDGVLYVAGGFDSKHDLATVEKLDPKTNSWQLVAKMQKKRSGLALHVLNHKLCAIGGYDGLKYLSAVESYDPRLDEWNLEHDVYLPSRMAHFATAIV